MAERERPPGVMAEYEERMARNAGIRNALDAEMVDLVADALRDGLWEVWGIHSPEQWLTWKLGISPGQAAKICRLAARVDEMPTLMALHRAGRLSLDQAATVARYTPAAYEASVAEFAQSATVAQIVRATSKYAFDVLQHERDAKAEARKEQRGPRRRVSFGSTSSDEWTMRAVLPAEEGAIVEEALKDQRRRLHDAARQRAKDLARAEGRSTTGTDRELGVAPPRWADALVGMAKVAATSDKDGDSVADRTGVLIHLRAPDADDVGGARWTAEMQQGPTLPDPLRRYLTCECDISVVWDRDGVPVQMGRASRNVPPRLRTLVLHRDHTCRAPGCTRHLWIQVHHIDHWEDGGDTVTPNLIALCSHHHKLHHQGLLGVEGNADATSGPDVVRFTTATGESLSPAPHVRPPGPGDCDRPEIAPYRHPTGERLQPWSVQFHRTPGAPAAPRPSSPVRSPERTPTP